VRRNAGKNSLQRNTKLIATQNTKLIATYYRKKSLQKSAWQHNKGRKIIAT